ncbi:MAG: hypothetical protein RIC55_07965 [Pirellulaceae bacterium]
MSDAKQSPIRKVLSSVVTLLVYGYFIGVVLATPYFNWCYARDNGFFNWVFFGEVVATAKAFVWPYYVIAGAGSSALTSEEKAFAEQWNQWLEDHPKEVNDLRTRAIADNMTKEEISREMIGLMVRFSNEANLDIPQRFIDDLKMGD